MPLAARVGVDCRALGNINKNRGIGRYTARLVEALAAPGGSRELVLFGYGHGPEPGLVDPGAIRRVEWRQVPAWGEVEFYGGPWNHPLLAREVRRSGVSLFHGIDHNMTPLLDCPSIVTVHDLIPLVLRGPYLGPRSRLWLAAHHAACRRAGVVLAVSEATRDDLVRIWRLPEEKVAVVHEGVTGSFRPAGEAGIVPALERYGITRPYLLYLGGFDPRKNIGNMLLGYKRFLLSTGSGASMVLCGDTGGFEGYLSAQVAELGLENRVLLPGFVSDEDLPALYSGALALLFVSLYEGFGLPLLEAMACGTPVIASGVSSIPWVAGDAALAVDPLDPGAIAAAIERVAGDAAERERLVSLGLERSSMFTWEKTADGVNSLYDRLLGGAA